MVLYFSELYTSDVGKMKFFDSLNFREKDED